MTSARLDILAEIHRLSTLVHHTVGRSLGQCSERDTPLGPRSQPASQSFQRSLTLLRDEAIASLETDLSERPLRADVRSSLVARFSVACDESLSAVQRGRATALHETSLPSAQYLAQVEQALLQSLSRSLCSNRQTLLRVVDDAVARFRSDAEAAAAASPFGDESEYGGPQQPEDARSHRSAAVAILEKAFEHAQAITIAEKQRLAAATGLEPRQVTIWFQNRRNRKTKDGEARYVSGSAKSTAAEPSASSPAADAFSRDADAAGAAAQGRASGKRKSMALDDERDDAPRLPSTFGHDADKRRRMADGSTQRTGSGSSASSLASRSSSSSLGSSHTSWDSVPRSAKARGGSGSSGTTVTSMESWAPMSYKPPGMSLTGAAAHMSEVELQPVWLAGSQSQGSLHGGGLSQQQCMRQHDEHISQSLSMMDTAYAAPQSSQASSDGSPPPEPSCTPLPGDMLLLDAYGQQLLDWDDLELDASLNGALVLSPEQLDLASGLSAELQAAGWSPGGMDLTTPRQPSFAQSASTPVSPATISQTILAWPESTTDASAFFASFGPEAFADLLPADADPKAQAPQEIHVPVHVDIGPDTSFSFAAGLESWAACPTSLEHVIEQWKGFVPSATPEELASSSAMDIDDSQMNELGELRRHSEQALFYEESQQPMLLA